MASNFHKPGATVSVTAPAAVTSGEFIVVGPALFGIASFDADAGDDLELHTSGVWRGLFSGASEGDPLYHDGSAITTSSASGANERIGVQLRGGLVKLNG